MVSRPAPGTRADYTAFSVITTRWLDNDMYGHMNNAMHYQLFDTAVNGHLIEQGVLDLKTSPTVFLVVETGCVYHGELAFPDVIHAGIRVARLGGSSVHYEIGLFRNDDDRAAAEGRFVHVNVDRVTRRPLPIADEARSVLEALMKAG
ncbi:acyl-CoA thioesterase [Sulfitobacter pseudonitzschiae]|uniref:Acyl-CoA thioesterase n=1 Tax=Pseudosulfitobacter pseudonitzschiae TaxID=1402135 RepID=A0A9Q2RVH6_9RHOB|nr:thioesterase family protein [Pseudosulfitobacter pseudonitzschiae]MBM2292256.1 acyl-CoA thioesterase [Pseudosulfitobacter pseudonitzschiae]MBM2297174.1 acyl-CoA thioesterase [Pseudosulfitobacter pseudonitzschiae]MBM2302088.1 acyl-CoA thioesterase [Pseudosulfitobacter pseudonitzschiae]MBM2311870.1 acyl-CoA thioesterase [Pseudosulfitobacter pseudonitzschiae]MBM2316784.1 acyl-CoA thioesterase [Pseudosulfitobacter pseudonitzschiae]